jgi:hypothetical protein
VAPASTALHIVLIAAAVAAVAIVIDPIWLGGNSDEFPSVWRPFFRRISGTH